MGKLRLLLYKVLYGILFVVIVPVLLILWAKYTAFAIHLPIPVNFTVAIIVILTGSILIMLGIWHLWIYGHGLPMNAFPPGKFVSNGIYSVLRHPVYSGAILLSFGISSVTGSPSGFWLVSPLFTLMVIAYVIGFENERTHNIYGYNEHRVFLSLPAPSDKPPLLNERTCTYILVFFAWFILNTISGGAGAAEGLNGIHYRFEDTLLILVTSAVLSFSAYVFVLATPLLIRTKTQLRYFITDIWFAAIITGIVYLGLPFFEKYRALLSCALPAQNGIITGLLKTSNLTIPYFWLAVVFISARYFTLNTTFSRWTWYLIAVFISAGCFMAGTCSIPDLGAGFSIFLIVTWRQKIWIYVLRISEHVANSWTEWRIGPLRVMNHGFYGGAAGFAGTLIACSFLERQYALIGFLTVIFIIAGAGLWAQIIEGSPKLLRPYGYYGGVVGLLISSVFFSLLFSINIFFLLGSFAMAAPWIQSIGRLRCLVQGCCHGRLSGEKPGIRFINPNSRVNKISGLSGLPLYPTQLYSIGANIITGLILIRLYGIGMSSSFIAGIYLIMNGLGRFVEEYFRGEAQTPYWAGMRIYQWIAVINIIIGAVLTTISNSVHLTFYFNAANLLYALAAGILVMFVSGVDFPESDKRFARLTS